MTQGNFTPQDKCEYVLNAAHYRPSSGMRHVRRRLGKLKVYFFIVLLSIGGGAGAVYLPQLLTPSESAFDLSNMKDPAELLEKAKSDPAMREQLEQLKKQYGR